MLDRPPTDRLRRLRFALSVLAALLSAACEGTPAPPALVLVTLDTTNAEALSCLGGPAGLTPALDALAAEGMLFTQARTVCPVTLPSHTSMMTGLVPPRHGVRDNGATRLTEAARTLAERAREAGWQTAAYVSALVLAPEFGLDQGFEVYDAPTGDPLAGAEGVEQTGAVTVSRAIDWLARRDPERPFFLWVHLFDPHAPYQPPPELLARAGGDAYLGEVAAADVAFGRLVAALRKEALADTTAWIVCGDHGEGRGRHGEQTHSVFCYDSTLHVPLIVRPAGDAARARRRDEPVSVVDVFPTALELMGLGPERDVDGRSLLATSAEKGRRVYFESFVPFFDFGWSPLAGVCDGEWKLIASSAPELYEVARDPGERNNLAEARGDLVQREREALRSYLARTPLPPPGRVRDSTLAAGLGALGYAGEEFGEAPAELPDPLAPGDLDSPREHIEEVARFLRAGVLAGREPSARVIAELEALVAQAPELHYARVTLADVLVRAGRPADALPHLERLIESGWSRPKSWRLLGIACERLGRQQEALAAYLRVLEIVPDDRYAQARITYLRRGR